MHVQNFENIVDEHADLVFNLALNYLQQKQDAEEVVQDVFMKVHLEYRHFNRQSSLKTWIYRITINQCLDVLRKRKRKRQPKYIGENIENAEQHFSIEGNYDHPGILLENKEGLNRLFDAINELPEGQKQVILLKYTEDLSVAEIAEVMDKSEKACESLLTRARKKLGDILEARRIEEEKNVKIIRNE